ncbi:hypothetical protein B0H14DRAFT_1250879 [Mycena olivaceomarginata]|nr:hypothetical protein B0H14DRAFT_1250879 [Mycena olivaceomarginata]
MNEKSFDTISERTLCASPEPLDLPPPPRPTRFQWAPVPPPPPRPTRVQCAPVPPIPTSPSHAARVHVRGVTVIGFALWSTNFSLSLVEFFHLVRTSAERQPQAQLRVLLAWAVCSGLLVLAATAVFVSTLFRRPSVRFIGFMHSFAIFMSATSCIVGFAVLFPAIAQCVGCSNQERAMRVFLCGGVPVASVWTWVWIPTVRKFVPATEK